MVPHQAAMTSAGPGSWLTGSCAAEGGTSGLHVPARLLRWLQRGPAGPPMRSMPQRALAARLCLGAGVRHLHAVTDDDHVLAFNFL